jgi:hypothetical protein
MDALRSQGEARNVVEHARARGPQTITKNGRVAAVLVSTHEPDCKAEHKNSLAEFFAASPLAGSGVVFSRLRTPARENDL